MTIIDVWDARIQDAHTAYPATATELTKTVTRRVVDGEEVIARLLRDLLSIDNVEVRRGQRPRLDVDEGRRLLNELRGQDYTVEPFHIAFRALAGSRSLENLTRRTGMSKANLSRLLAKKKLPRVDELETIAEAFGKRPMYFAEYRTAMFTAIVQNHLAADPDRSAALAHQMGLGR